MVAMNRKRLLVDVVGYSSFFLIFLLYNYLERTYAGYIAGIVAIVAILPVAAVWHYLYGKFSNVR